MTHTITWLDDEHVTEIRITEAPLHRSASGYGRKIPTQYMLKIAGRWHRVYMMCYSNSGTAYVLKGGEELILESATEYRMEGYERAVSHGNDVQPVRLDKVSPGERFRFHDDGVVSTLYSTSSNGAYYWSDYQGEHKLHAGVYSLTSKPAWPYVFPTNDPETEVDAA